MSLPAARNDEPKVDPRRVIERWTEVWNEGRVEWIGELVANPCLRHHPGKLDTLTTAENVDRVRAGRERFGRVSFENVVLVAAGEYVTSCYIMRFDDADNPGVRRETAGIELFRVVGGRITETWNTDPGAGSWR